MTRTKRTMTDREPRRPPSRELPVPFLARVLAFERPCAPGSRHELADLDEVRIGRGDRDGYTRKSRALELAIADERMSQRHARLVHGDGGWTLEDLGSRNGTLVDGVKTDRATLEPGTWIELGRTALRFAIDEPGERQDITADTLAAPIGELRTFSTTFARAFRGLARVALTRQSVVLHGETGTGKELIARGVHGASRRTGSFVAVNCGALPATLVESELFGYRKGAFSGALEDRLGLVRSADGGTLFLDEIGDLPLATQAALLRVLQEREVLPIGGTRPVAVDVRVIAATHRDLEREVVAGRFRDDLLARLAGYVIAIPALRARPEDLGILIAALLVRLGPDAMAVRLTPAAGEALLHHRWPRNVRELEQVLGSAVALATSGTIELDHLPPALHEPAGAAADELSPAEVRRRDELRRLLAKHRGNIAAVGRSLGVARMQVHRWLDRYGIAIDDYRRDDDA